MASTASSDDELLVLLTPGGPNALGINIRVSPEHEDELLELLDSHGIQHSGIIELSHTDIELAIQAVEAGSAALTALSVALAKLFGRHKHKKVSATVGDTSVTVEGYSAGELKAVLDTVAQAQLELLDQWQRMLQANNDRQLPGEAET